jgi:hypothetical protein
MVTAGIREAIAISTWPCPIPKSFGYPVSEFPEHCPPYGEQVSFKHLPFLYDIPMQAPGAVEWDLLQRNTAGKVERAEEGSIEGISIHGN